MGLPSAIIVPLWAGPTIVAALVISRINAGISCLHGKANVHMANAACEFLSGESNVSKTTGEISVFQRRRVTALKET